MSHSIAASAHGWTQCHRCWNWLPRNLNSDSTHARANGFVVAAAAAAEAGWLEPEPAPCAEHDVCWLDGCDCDSTAAVAAAAGSAAGSTDDGSLCAADAGGLSVVSAAAASAASAIVPTAAAAAVAVHGCWLPSPPPAG